MVLRGEFIDKLFHISFRVCIAILFLGIFCSGVGYVLWAQALKEMEAAKAGAFLYFEPFVTLITAWIFLNEKITFLMILSGIIITSGVLLVNINIKQLLKLSKKSIVKN
jgi:drug/metabolite transporter (DMT)-like permease